MASQHTTSMDEWAHDAIQHDKRRPMLLGTLGLAGVGIVLLLMLYAISQMAGYY